MADGDWIRLTVNCEADVPADKVRLTIKNMTSWWKAITKNTHNADWSMIWHLLKTVLVGRILLMLTL